MGIVLEWEVMPTASEETKRSSMDHSEKNTVLLVDDDQMVLSVTKQLLERLGYQVIKAQGGEEAITLAMNFQDRIALAILDMVMPGMDGPSTFRRLREMMPDLKVLLCSGYVESEQVHDLVENGAVGFIRKPFDRKTLERELRGALRG